MNTGPGARYIRKEKMIAEGKLDVIETECSRLRQRCEALERQLEASNQQLAEEREQAQVCVCGGGGRGWGKIVNGYRCADNISNSN